MFHPLTPMGDQDRISPYNIDTLTTISGWKVMRFKEKDPLGDYLLVDPYLILQTNIIRIVWQTVRRITKQDLRSERVT